MLFYAVCALAVIFVPQAFAQAAAPAPIASLNGDVPPLSQPVLEVAVFRVAPVAAATNDVRARHAALTSPSPGPAAVHVEAGHRFVEVRSQKGERWDDIFKRAAANLAVRLPAGAAQARSGAMPQLVPGKYLRARMAADGAFEVEYVLTANEVYAFSIGDDALQVRPLAGDPRLVERMRADPSKASLFTATDAIGLPETIALQLTEIFSGEVDFLRELHLGYRCAIVYEAHYREGFIERSGRILAAELDVGNRSFRAYFATDKNGHGAYFDGSGKTTRRLFRRSPLEFTRITSDYTLARFHPILGVWTAHRGVDYAAPAGTKIMSVADGVVEFVGSRGGYGNLVTVRHQDKFLTYYAHMSAFVPKLAPGAQVAQGETIGFVGMTGLATGPHLHFEFHVRRPSGEWVSVPAPDVMDTTLVAAPDFAQKVQVYRNNLAAVSYDNLLIIE